MGLLLLAWRYLSYHRGRTLILLAAIGLTVFLPLATHWAIAKFEARAVERANHTPLVIASKGSRFAATLHALYFRGESPPAVKYAEFQRVEEFGFGQVIPLNCKFRARGVSIVGTSIDYYQLRGLVLAQGEPLDRLGDCVVGANAAIELGIHPGDHLLTESENMFDLSGAWPLKLRVTGVLAPSNTADDDVVFCDLKTTWIMEGIGHGHAVTSDVDGDSQHSHAASSQNLQQFQEVTENNLRSFHFHGKRGDYPLTELIVVPDSDRSSTLMQGKYLDAASPYQIVRPSDVLTELMNTIGRVRNLFDIGMICLCMITVALIALVMMLSIRLRQNEIRTLFMLGCSRGTISKVVLLELAIVFFSGSALGLLFAYVATGSGESLLMRLL